MNKNYLEAVSAPAHSSTWRFAMIGAGVAAFVLGVWWYVAPSQDVPLDDPHLRSGAPNVSASPVLSPGLQDIVPSNTGVSASGPSPGVNTAAAVPIPENPPGDLLAAIKRAQAASAAQSPAPPLDQASWQGMPQKDAAKVFKDAVDAASAASVASPFSQKKD